MSCLLTPFQKLGHFIVDDTPRDYGYKQNILESVGNLILYPSRQTISLISTKSQNDSCLWNTMNKVVGVALTIILIPLILIGSLIKAIGTWLPHSFEEVNDSHIEPTDPMKVEQCYELASIISQAFKDAGIKDENGNERLYMVSGTELGNRRHGGMIPWDDDLDFALSGDDEKLFLDKVLPLLKEQGLEIQNLRSDSTYKLRFNDEKMAEKYDCPRSKGGEIDIFIWNWDSQGHFTYDASISRARWPNEYFTREEFDHGMVSYQYGPKGGNLTLIGLQAGPADTYLKRYYGENCMERGLETHGHFSVRIPCCGNINIPFLKMNPFFFKIEIYKGPAEGLNRFKKQDEAV